MRDLFQRFFASQSQETVTVFGRAMSCLRAVVPFKITEAYGITDDLVEIGEKRAESVGRRLGGGQHDCGGNVDFVGYELPGIAVTIGVAEEQDFVEKAFDHRRHHAPPDGENEDEPGGGVEDLKVFFDERIGGLSAAVKAQR